MSRSTLLPTLILLLPAVVLVGCGGDESPAVRSLAVFPLDDRAAVPDPAADVEVVDDPGRGPVLYASAERARKVIIGEVALTEPVHGPLTVVGHFRTEMIDAAVTWQLRLESAEGAVRFITTPSYEYDRTHDWRVFNAEFVLQEGERFAHVTLAALLPPGRLWVDDVVLWDGAPRTGAPQ